MAPTEVLSTDSCLFSQPIVLTVAHIAAELVWLAFLSPQPLPKPRRIRDGRPSRGGVAPVRRPRCIRVCCFGCLKGAEGIVYKGHRYTCICICRCRGGC